MSLDQCAHPFRACPAHAACGSWEPLLQRQRKCGWAPVRGRRLSAPPPKSSHNGPCVVSSPAKRVDAFSKTVFVPNVSHNLFNLSNENDASDTRRTCSSLTHILHVFWFVCWGVPAIVQDEDVRLWETFVHFMEKVFFLRGRETLGLASVTLKRLGTVKRQSSVIYFMSGLFPVERGVRVCFPFKSCRRIDWLCERLFSLTLHECLSRQKQVGPVCGHIKTQAAALLLAQHRKHTHCTV